MTSEVAVITVARGRRDHLHRQRDALNRDASSVMHVVVDLGGEPIGGSEHVIPFALDADDDRLPLAAARNIGAAAASERGASVLVFLDADVIPGPGCIAAYRDALERSPDQLVIAIGPVAYLAYDHDPDQPISTLLECGHIQPGRPRFDDEPGVFGDWDLFWSLSFACTTTTYGAVGGFDERYVGYGGEDTDFARRSERAGAELINVPAAAGVHQWHPVEHPPVRHLDSIVANARRFRGTWGTWPMTGWLRQFASDGLITRDPGGDHVAVVRR